MSTETPKSYDEIASINVNAYVEKKGGLSYLSWAFAVDQLLRLDAEANWSYAEPERMADGTMMVFCTVTAFGRARTMQLPVMDHRNKPIANPDAFAVNTAMQRCLVKAIALHGLGLYIYAGEDVPRGGEQEPEPEKPVDPARAGLVLALESAFKDGGIDALRAGWQALTKEQRALVGMGEIERIKAGDTSENA